MELSEKWPIYLWDACKRFGAEFYRTWRWELFTSLLIAAAAYGITVYDDPQAWKNLVVTVQASAYVLSGFAIWHIIRTPLLVHRETVAQRRVSDHWGFGVLGILALGGLSLGIYHVAGLVLQHQVPCVVISVPSADPGAKDATIAELRQAQTRKSQFIKGHPPHPTPCTMEVGTYYPTSLDMPGGEDYKRPAFELEGSYETAWSWDNDEYLFLQEITLTNRGVDSIVKDWELCLVRGGKALMFQAGSLPDKGVTLPTGERITRDQTLMERAIKEPIKHGRALSGWIAWSVPKELATLIISGKIPPTGAIRLKDYLAHTYSYDFVPAPNTEVPKGKVYIPGHYCPAIS